MSRVGKKPIPVIDSVTVDIKDQEISVKGPKGTLSLTFPECIEVVFDSDAKMINVSTDVSDKKKNALFGLTRSLIYNNICGVSEGWVKKLEIRGVGYRANIQGKALNLTLGFSHPVKYDFPEGIDIKVDENTKITVSGADKQLVGQVAADIRAYRKPEPYKGKGVRYIDEVVIQKEGKSVGA